MKSFFSSLLLAFLFIGNISAQKVNSSFFDSADKFFAKHVKNGLVDYANLRNSAELKSLLSKVENADLSGASAATEQAFLINAYNLHVINGALENYPLNSVLSVSGFFDRRKIKVAGETLALNKLEKEKLLKKYNDARFHFVLVCGALGCPPITNFAYRPGQLEQQLEQQTRLALNDDTFIKVNSKGAQLSQIFEWYASDFGGNKKAVLNFINKYRTNKIPANSSVSYYEYDWTLNSQSGGNSGVEIQSTLGAANDARYVVSSAIPKGSVELKVFNNLYTQRTGSEENLTDRATFFTTSLTALYGVSNRFNAGISTRYRRVRNDQLPSSPLDVFGSGEAGTSRSGITAFGPQIRYAPFEKLENFSIQSSFVFPIGEDLAGSATEPYIDWNGATWHTQFFNDISIGSRFSIFTEIDFLLEDIGNKADGHINRFSTPGILIFSYFPNPKTTLYTIGGFSPFWQSEFDYFVQGGFGAKYQFTPNFELELLYTSFTNKFLRDTGGDAATFNFGIRYNL